jgi:hypothetical protein
MAQASDKPQHGDYGSEWVGAACGVLMSMLWLVAAFASTKSWHVFGGNGSKVALITYAVVECGLMVGLVKRNRIAWVFAVSLSGALLIPAGVIGLMLLFGGDPLAGLLMLVPYVILFATQVACLGRMRAGAHPRLMAAGVGLATAVLWLISGLQGANWTAATMAGFGGGGIPLVAVVILAAVEAGLSIGIFRKSRAAWAFAVSLACTLGLPLVIGVTRMQWRGEYIPGTTALFLHVVLLVVQASAFEQVAATDDEVVGT